MLCCSAVVCVIIVVVCLFLLLLFRDYMCLLFVVLFGIVSAFGCVVLLLFCSLAVLFCPGLLSWRFLFAMFAFLVVTFVVVYVARIMIS